MIRDIFAVSLVFFAAVLNAGNVSNAYISSMGGGGAVSARGAEAVFFNPASLVNMEAAAHRVFSGYTIRSGDSDNAAAAFAYHDDEFGYFGAGAVYRDSGIMEISAADRNEFNAEAEFVYANRLFYSLSCGASLKGLFGYLSGERTYGYSVDAGLVYQPVESMELFLGIYGENIIKGYFGGNNTQYPDKTGYSAGVSHLFLDGIIGMKYDISVNEDMKKIVSGAGIEINSPWYVSLRAGVDDMQPVFGAGIKYKMYEVDYALCGYNEEDIHRISLNLSW